MRWRVVGLEEHDAFTNMAIDEVLLTKVGNKSSPPTIRFYTWSPGAVSIGRFQSMSDEVNLDRCREMGVDCIRRITGGGAVYHAVRGEVTYSLVGPESAFNKGIRESYKEICAFVIKGLGHIGIKAEFAPINDILVDGKKISGNAQTRRQGALLQHGTVLYSLDISTMFSLLNVSKEKVSDKEMKSVEDRVTCVSNHVGVSIGGLYTALMRGFTDGLDFEVGSLTYQELDDTEELAEAYRSREWNFSR